jgi:hypothetical protein
MATSLTSIAIKTRKSIRYGIYSLILIMLLRFVWGIVKADILPILFPPKLPPATLGFGNLPKINFPAAVEPLPELSYKLETASGSLPEFPLNMNVYYMPKAAATLSSVDTAKTKAQALGYATKPIEISETVYRFNHPKVPSVLEMNIVTGTFSASFSLAADSSPLNFPPPDQESAKSTIVDILKSANSYPKDLTVFGEPEFLKLEGQNLVKALSRSEANLIKLSLFRQPMGENSEYPSLTKYPAEGNVWFILSGANENNKKVIGSEFHYYPISKDNPETYPIKTAQQAFEELQNDQAFIASLGLNKDGNVTIRKVYLAYFDPETPEQFFQPIIVFEGDRGFAAYVPAITAENYETEGT